MSTGHKTSLLLLLLVLLLTASCSKTREGGRPDGAAGGPGVSNPAGAGGGASEFVEAGEETFQVEDRLTMEVAKELHRRLPEEVKGLRSKYEPCGRRRGERDCVFADNFPLIEAAEELTMSCATVPLSSWATPSEADGGVEAVRLWKRRAAAQEVFDCDGPDCKIIVYATTPDPATTVLANCRVAKVGDVLGAPERCEPVAILSRETTLVSVIYGISQVFCHIGPTRFNLVIVHPPSVSDSAIRDALRNALSNPPLSCSVDVGEEKITGTGSYRVSPILSPYREMMTARVSTRKGEGEPRHFGVRISVDLYVNRYNTTRRKDWRLPDDDQEKKYEQAVKALVKSSLESACRTSYWRDENLLLCDLPPETPVDGMLRFLIGDF